MAALNPKPDPSRCPAFPNAAETRANTPELGGGAGSDRDALLRALARALARAAAREAWALACTDQSDSQETTTHEHPEAGRHIGPRIRV